jgi:hypothetical protein
MRGDEGRKNFLQGLADESPRGEEAQESNGSTQLLKTNWEQDAQLIAAAETVGASSLSPRV